MKKSCETPWVIVFDFKTFKGCHTILQNFQGWKLFIYGISKVEVTILKILEIVSRIVQWYHEKCTQSTSSVMPKAITQIGTEDARCKWDRFFRSFFAGFFDWGKNITRS